MVKKIFNSAHSYRQLILAVSMIATIAIGIVGQFQQWFCIHGLLGRFGGVLVGVTLIADYSDRTWGIFTGSKSVQIASHLESPVNMAFSIITILGALVGTFVWSFGDLLPVATGANQC